MESWLCCRDDESNIQSNHKKRKQTQPKTLYQRVSMLLPTEEFSFKKTCEKIFPKSGIIYHHTEHAILPIMITKDGKMFQDQRARKKH
jgi:hypothetical protein